MKGMQGGKVLGGERHNLSAVRRGCPKGCEAIETEGGETLVLGSIHRWNERVCQKKEERKLHGG